VIVSPQTPGQPESGRIRGRYIRNNAPVGNYSPEYAVTVSAWRGWRWNSRRREPRI